MNLRRTLATAAAAVAGFSFPIILTWAQGPQGADPGRPAAARPIPKNAPRFQVFRIIDGSTVAVILNGQPVPVHLLGVELPAVRPSVRKQGGDRAGQEAAQFLKDQALDKAVLLDFEPGRPQRDQEGRILAYVFLASDGKLINRELIAAGHARVALNEVPSAAQDLRSAEQTAKNQHLGIWAAAAEKPDATAKPGSDATKAAADTADEPADEQVYVARGSTRYHRAGCHALGKHGTAISLAEASKKYTACPKCHPDSAKATAKSGSAGTTAHAKPKKRRYQSQAAQREALDKAFNNLDPTAGSGSAPGVPPY